MTTLYHWRFFCETENTYVYKWDTVAPTKCPNDTTDTIDTNSITIVEEITDNLVLATIKEEIIPTGGHWRCEGVPLLNCTPGVTTHDFTWPYRISALSMTGYPQTINSGDIVNGYVNPETVAGVITSTINSGDTVINVSPTVINNAVIGMRIGFKNTSNSYDFSYIVSVNNTDSQLTIFPSATNSYNAGTYVTLDIQFLKNLYLPSGFALITGHSKIGAASISSNSVVRIEYINNTSETKTMSVQLEYLY